MKKKKVFQTRSLVLAAFALLVIVMSVVLINLWGGVKQPISFNHGIHAENELECLDCHAFYEERASSGKPKIEVCAGCHEEPMGESREEKKVVEHVTAGREIDWQRLYRVPEDVYFSHRRHVKLGELDCSTCHGSIGESSKPPKKPIKITMKKCMNCHDDRDVDNDCIFCHR